VIISITIGIIIYFGFLFPAALIWVASCSGDWDCVFAGVVLLLLQLGVTAFLLGI